MSIDLPAIQKKLTDYCEIRTKVLAILSDARRMLILAEKEMKSVYTYGLPHDISRSFELEYAAREIDKRLWRQAFEQTGFMQMMDRQALAKFNADNEQDPPPFTVENIRATFLTLFQGADEMFARGLVNVFRGLSSRYRTNDQPFKLERRVVLSGICQSGWSGGVRISYRDYASGTINDLDRVFHVLDGKQHHPRALEAAINAEFDTNKRGPWVYEDTYFQMRGFLNGNAHIIFKRADLLEKANRVIHDYYDGRALPDDGGAAA